MQCILAKSDEFENSYPLLRNKFFLNLDYIAACSLRSNKFGEEGVLDARKEKMTSDMETNSTLFFVYML